MHALVAELPRHLAVVQVETGERPVEVLNGIVLLLLNTHHERRLLGGESLRGPPRHLGPGDGSLLPT